MIRYILRIVFELVWIDWQYVGSFDVGPISYTPASGFTNEDFGVIVHCYESRWGTRHGRIRILSGSPLNIFRNIEIRRSLIYQTEVYPWLRGRTNSKIPTYKKIKSKKWDFMRMLRGKKIEPLNSEEQK